MEQKLNVDIIRNTKIGTCLFKECFKGFEKVEVVKKMFGERVDDVLDNLKVEIVSRQGYMGVSNADGHLIISAQYMKEGDAIDIYLDVIHELTHVKQFMDGRELFDNRFRYVDRPTEIEAYHNAVSEARRLGLSDERICDYLQPNWVTDEDLLALAKALNVKCKIEKSKQ